MIKTNTSENKYLYFNSLTTSELKNLITSDFYSENDSIDSDGLIVILQILEKRESGHKCDAQNLWKSFSDYYLPLAKRKISLYESSISFSQYKPLRSKRLIVFIALIIFIVTISATGIAKKFMNVFPISTAEYFGGHEDITLLSKEDLQEFFQLSSLPEHIVPTWLPPELVLTDKSSCKNSSFEDIYLHYDNSTNTEYLNFSISYLKTDVASYYEKDNTPVEIYTKDNVDFYIMKNIDDIVVVWKVDNFECHLSGTISHEEIMKIIDSI